EVTALERIEPLIVEAREEQAVRVQVAKYAVDRGLDQDAVADRVRVAVEDVGQHLREGLQLLIGSTLLGRAPGHRRGHEQGDEQGPSGASRGVSWHRRPGVHSGSGRWR